MIWLVMTNIELPWQEAVSGFEIESLKFFFHRNNSSMWHSICFSLFCFCYQPLVDTKLFMFEAPDWAAALDLTWVACCNYSTTHMWFVFIEPVLPGKSASVDWKLVDPMKIINLRKADHLCLQRCNTEVYLMFARTDSMFVVKQNDNVDDTLNIF